MDFLSRPGGNASVGFAVIDVRAASRKIHLHCTVIDHGPQSIIVPVSADPATL